jgi:3-hydroxybutyryl-CoA dehydrogenase
VTANGLMRAGVAGAGTMGSGIAITIARSGIRVVVYDVAEATLSRSRRQIESFFAVSAAKGKLSADEAAQASERVVYTSDIRHLAEVDVVVEAIFEDLAVKESLFAQLDAVCAADTLFLTNTSTLSVTQLAAVSGRADRVVGAHYCLPAQLMKLVEMSRALQTSDDAWDRAWEFETLTLQHPIETKDRPGFVLNHFCIPYHNDAIRMVETQVAKPADIDRAMKESMGFAMGPCELLDLIGLDTQLRASEALFGATNDPRSSPPPLLRRMVAAGQLGRKTKQGFYSYADDSLFGA